MDDKHPLQVIPGHVGYAPDYKSDKPNDFLVVGTKDAITREKLLRRVAERAKPVLKWDREKAEAWLPGLYDALKALEEP